jgi:uncharacterized protein
MAKDLENIVVKNNEGQHRYEVEIEDHLAELVYSRRGDQITLMHTGVPPALEGRGIAGKLAQTALDEARQQKLTVDPACPYVASYIHRHQEYLDLLSPPDQERLKRG